jgi:hypothetical protein
MKIVFALILLVWGQFANAEEDTPIKLKKSFDKFWKVIRLSHYHFMGDYDSEEPVIFIQSLPDNRLLISEAVQRRFDPLIPKPVRFMEADEWEKVQAQIIEHYSAAFVSDPKSQVKKNGFGSDIISINISVTGLETTNFSRRFSLADDSSKRFQKFLQEILDIPP